MEGACRRGDVDSVRHIYPEHEGTRVDVKFGGVVQKWWYLRGVGIDHVLLIKYLDNGASGEWGGHRIRVLSAPEAGRGVPARSSLKFCVW